MVSRCGAEKLNILAKVTFHNYNVKPQALTRSLLHQKAEILGRFSHCIIALVTCCGKIGGDSPIYSRLIVNCLQRGLIDS